MSGTAEATTLPAASSAPPPPFGGAPGAGNGAFQSAGVGTSSAGTRRGDSASPARAEAGTGAVRQSFQGAREEPAEDTPARQPPPLFRDGSVAPAHAGAQQASASPLPASGREARVSRYRDPGGREVLLLDARGGDDAIEVDRDGDAGGIVVTVNGEAYRFTREQAKSLTLEGGRGDDTIRVAEEVWTGLTIRGGRGDDAILVGRTGPRIHNVHGGPGDDLIREPATAQALASLSPDQRAYFDAIQRHEPPIATKAALDAARISRPLTAEDRQRIVNAQNAIENLPLEPIVDPSNPNQVVLHITFDGTWFDREEMPVESNPALLEYLAASDLSRYFPGVGTDPITKLIAGATGMGAKARIEKAYAEVVRRAQQESERGREVVIVLSGFSRGAASARAFANMLNDRGVPMADGRGGTEWEAPRIGAMVLFDTVASFGIPGNEINLGYDLNIPPNVENVLHLTASNEARNFFPLTSAVDPARPDDRRITEIGLPGSHTDIGGSHPNPYSRLVLGMAYQYLEKLGVPLEPLGALAPPSASDPSLRLHDSGGMGRRPVYPVTNP